MYKKTMRISPVDGIMLNRKAKQKLGAYVLIGGITNNYKTHNIIMNKF